MKKRAIFLFLIITIFNLNINPTFAADCTAIYTGKIPLNDLGVNFYNGYQGGLYPNGSNTRPSSYEEAGVLVSEEVEPLNSAGQVDLTNGHIGFVSIGMSNTNQEFEVFEYAANVDPFRNPRVTFINGAQHGYAAHIWADPNSIPWTVLEGTIANEGLTNPQVQVAWVKLTIRAADIGDWGLYPFPTNATLFQSLVKTTVQNLKDKYPNIKIAYLSSRIYGGYGPGTSSPEPMAYQEGFGIKWLIEEQINGDPDLSYSGENPEAPYLSWGPYLWADGLGSDGVVGGVFGRADGMEYACSDFASDGLHPSTSGREKVADQLVNFLNSDATTQSWYINQTPPPPTGTPYYINLNGGNNYIEAADSDSFSFTNGTADTPLTFETWIRPDNLSGKRSLISKWISSPNQEYKLYLSSGIARLDIRDRSTGAIVSVYTGNLSSIIGTWHHLAVTYDGRGGSTAANGVNFYLDGNLMSVTRANNASYVAMENGTIPLQIGRESNSYQQFMGGMDELRMWNVARTPSEIMSNLDVELLGTEPGLVGYWRFNEGVGATVVDNSPNNNTAIMYNNPAWLSGGPMAPPAPDVTSPIISNIVRSNLTDSGVTISFTTNEVTTGWVSHTPLTSCPCTDVYSSTVGTNHTVNLIGLTPETFYIYEVKVQDEAENFQVGPTLNFTTLAVPPDTISPIVSITNPTAGNVTGTVSVVASATDNIGVSNVQFKLDGVNYGAIDSSAPYLLSLDTTTIADGPHTLTAEAVDEAGNTGISTGVLVTVNNDLTPPAVFITAPTDSSTVSGANVIISASASDNVGVTGVQFKIDGVNFGTEDTALPYSLTWNTTSIENGTHSIIAVGRDSAGNIATSSVVSVDVYNIAPPPPPPPAPGPSNPVLLDVSSSDVNKTSHTSQTISPSPNSLLMVSVSTAAPSGNFTLSVADTLPGTDLWNQVSVGNTQAHSWRITVFYVQTGSLPGSGTITVTSSMNASRWVMHVSEIQNASVFQSATNFGNSPNFSVTFASQPAPNSLTFGAVASRRDSDRNISSGGGFTEHSENNIALDPSNTLQTQYGPSTLSSIWSGLGNSNNVGVALEIR